MTPPAPTVSTAVRPPDGLLKPMLVTATATSFNLDSAYAKTKPSSSSSCWTHSIACSKGRWGGTVAACGVLLLVFLLLNNESSSNNSVNDSHHAAALRLREITSDNNHQLPNYDNYDWKELPPHVKQAAKQLQWTPKSWNQNTDYPAVYYQPWSQLTGAEQDAATLLGYTIGAWETVLNPTGAGDNTKVATNDDDDYDYEIDVEEMLENLEDVEEDYEYAEEKEEEEGDYDYTQTEPPTSDTTSTTATVADDGLLVDEEKSQAVVLVEATGGNKAILSEGVVPVQALVISNFDDDDDDGNDDDNIARALLANYGFDPDDLNKECNFGGRSETPMMYFCRIGDLTMCRYLFSRGANFRTVDSFGRFPMLAAAAGGHLEIIQWLCRAVGVQDDIRKQSMFGDSPLFIALDRDHFGVVYWLILQGALAPRDDVDGGGIDDRVMRSNLDYIDTGWRYDKRLTVLLWSRDAVTTYDHAVQLLVTGTIVRSNQESSLLVTFKGTSGILELIARFVAGTQQQLRTTRQLMDRLSTLIDETPFIEEEFEDDY